MSEIQFIDLMVVFLLRHVLKKEYIHQKCFTIIFKK